MAEFGRVLQVLGSSGAFRTSVWALTVVLAVALIGNYADRIGSALERLYRALDVRAARKAALSAKTVEDRKHALEVLRALQKSPDEPPPLVRQLPRNKRQGPSGK